MSKCYKLNMNVNTVNNVNEIYHHIWNEKETNILYGGAETPSFLLEEFFPNSEILKRIVYFVNKWHLIPFSEIHENDLKEIVELMEEIEDFNGDLRNL